MSSRDSGENSNTLNLSANQTFSGKPTDVSGFTKCGVSVLCDQPITLFIYQSMTGTIVDKVDTYVVPAVIKPAGAYTEFSPQKRAVELNYRFVWVTAKNATATATTYCRIQTQLYNAGFLEAEHDRVEIWGKTAGEVKKSILVDDTGKLITSTEITGLTLTPDDDGVGMFGSSDGTNRVILKTDADGKLETSTQITGLTLSPDDDGVAVYGSDGTNLIVLKTDADGKLETTSVVSGAVSVSNFPATQVVSGAVSVSNFPATQVVNDTTGNPLLTSLNVNANKASFTDSLISTPTAVGVNGDVGLAVDLGIDENRYRNIVFRGEVDVSVNTDPKIIMSYSDDNTDYHSDGTFASFYKKTPTTYEFCFQRSNIGLRYVKLVAQNATTFNYVKSTTSKY